MDTFKDTLSSFYLGDNGLSFPTDVIVERSKDAALFKDSVIFVNQDTLIRNAIAAINIETEFKDNIVERVTTDLNLLKAHFINFGVEVYCYTVYYDNVFKDARIKRKCIYDNYDSDKLTNNQRREKKLVKLARELLDKTITNNTFTKFFKNPDSIKIKNAFIITHLAVDLLEYNSFQSLKLLESFTGNIKESINFNSKLNIHKDLIELIPFNHLTYVAFGDNALLGKQPTVYIKKMIEIAKLMGWTRATTFNRVEFTLNLKDRVLYEYLLTLTK